MKKLGILCLLLCILLTIAAPAYAAEDLSVARLCRTFHLSRSALYALSKEHFGCGISDHVQACRLTAAQSLLSEQDLSIAQIAEQVGIPDANYFTRCFKKAFGTTPKQFRRT